MYYVEKWVIFDSALFNRVESPEDQPFATSIAVMLGSVIAMAALCSILGRNGADNVKRLLAQENDVTQQGLSFSDRIRRRERRQRLRDMECPNTYLDTVAEVTLLGAATTLVGLVIMSRIFQLEPLCREASILRFFRNR